MFLKHSQSGLVGSKGDCPSSVHFRGGEHLPGGSQSPIMIYSFGSQEAWLYCGRSWFQSFEKALKPDESKEVGCLLCEIFIFWLVPITWYRKRVLWITCKFLGKDTHMLTILDKTRASLCPSWVVKISNLRLPKWIRGHKRVGHDLATEHIQSRVEILLRGTWNER